MLFACWSTKGGVGTTVVTALVALHLARADGARVLAIDLDGDLAAALGAAPPGVDGLTDWLAAPRESQPGALPRLAQPVAPGLRLVGRGHAAWDGAWATPEQARSLGHCAQHVVVDCGRLGRDDPMGPWLAGTADQSLQVVRLCYLALRRAQTQSTQPTGLVVVAEEGRSLTAADAVRVTGVPLLAEIALDRSIARAVDAGLLASRLPRALDRAFSGLGQ